MANYYELLGISSNATLDMITQHFREKTQGLLTTRDMSDPHAVNEYQMLTTAYRTLTNPERRQQYDASLAAAVPPAAAAPPPPTAPATPQVDLPKLWKTVSETFFERAERYTPAIDAVRACMPLTVTDEHQLIIAIPPEHSNLMAYLTPTVTYNQVKKILGELTGRPLEYRVIIGKSLKDWEFVKEGEELARQKRAAQSHGENADSHLAHLTTTIPHHDESEWESMVEYLVHQWSEVENRTYPQSRATFIIDQLPFISDTETRTREAGMAEEVIQRHLARVLAKIGNLSGVDAAVVALEYMRYRERVVGGTP